MTGTELAALLDAALLVLAGSRDELRDLDAALGDGDLGITVDKGCAAVRAKLVTLTDPMPAEVLQAAGTAFANANPSTMAALVGGGLLAGSRVVGAAADLGQTEAAAFGHAAAGSIAKRGKAQLGDKTMLDAIIPSLELLDTATGDRAAVLAAMIEAARRAVAETTSLQSRRGRAAWLGERSSGHADPGATAYVRLLEALHEVSS